MKKLNYKQSNDRNYNQYRENIINQCILKYKSNRSKIIDLYRKNGIKRVAEQLMDDISNQYNDSGSTADIIDYNNEDHDDFSQDLLLEIMERLQEEMNIHEYVDIYDDVIDNIEDYTDFIVDDDTIDLICPFCRRCNMTINNDILTCLCNDDSIIHYVKYGSLEDLRIKLSSVFYRHYDYCMDNYINNSITTIDNEEDISPNNLLTISNTNDNIEFYCNLCCFHEILT